MHRSMRWTVFVAFAVSIVFNTFGLWRVNDLSESRARDNRRFTEQIARIGNDAIRSGCQRVNGLRDGLRFVEDTVVALRPKEEAILRDPMSTPEQRVDAQQTIEFGTKIHDALRLEQCGTPLPTH